MYNLIKLRIHPVCVISVHLKMLLKSVIFSRKTIHDFLLQAANFESQSKYILHHVDSKTCIIVNANSKTCVVEISLRGSGEYVYAYISSAVARVHQNQQQVAVTDLHGNKVNSARRRTATLLICLRDGLFQTQTFSLDALGTHRPR